MAQDIRRSFHISAKALGGGLRVFVEVCSEMDNNVVVRDARRVRFTEHVQVRTAREIVRAEESANVYAEIAASACHQ